MPVSRFLQSSFATGEFDPLLASREDVAFYYTSASLIENAIPLPQGGAKRREGLRFAANMRGPLSSVDTSGFTVAAPNGGTASNLFSTDRNSTIFTTTPIGTNTVHVIATFSQVGGIEIDLADFNGRIAGGNISTGTLALQSSDDGVTYTTRASLTIGTSVLDRRWAAPTGETLGTAQFWRIVFLNPDANDYGTGDISIFNFAIRTEASFADGAVVGNVKLRSLNASFDDEYFVVLSQGNADIYTAAGLWVAAVKIPHGDADVLTIKTSQQQDTMVLYHPDFPPYVIQRLNGLDVEWRSGEFVFTTVPLFPFGDATTGGRVELQEVQYTSINVGDRYQVEYNGEISDEIIWDASGAINISRLDAALQSLDGITSVQVSSTVPTIFEVQFLGVDANRFWPLIIYTVLSGSATIENTRRRAGRPNVEDLFSPTRGYPRCGTFYQGRHWMGGFRGRSDVIIGSRVGDFTDFVEDNDPVATSPLVLAPDIDQQVTVENIYAGRNLQIFTSSAELYIPSEPITPDTIALKVSSKRGSSALTQPVDVQGGTMFVDRNGTALREYLFLDTEQSYTAEPISTLGGHLVQDPTDIALRRSVDNDEPTMVYMVNQGRDRNFDKVPTASITIDRAQSVTAFSRITSGNGNFVSVAATQGGEVAFAVERELAGARWKHIEILDSDFMGDHSEEVANPDIDQLTATEGQAVFSYTFANPADDNDIAVFTREDAADIFRRVDPSLYSLDTGAKTITLATGLDADVTVAICKRATSFTTSLATLEGIECYVHGDGRPLGTHTPASGVVNILSEEGFFFNARIGLRMVPTITLQPFKGQGGPSPTMQRQRIFRMLLNVERTASMAVSMEGATPRNVAFPTYDTGIYDSDLEDNLFTGTKRISGVGSWQIEPRLKITQTEPAPWFLRSVSYDIRF